MLLHVILGLLRDGQPRHGYELMCEYRARSGTKLSAGNFYRELARMMSDSLVQTGINPPGADARRIPYQIAERGRQSFDRWLVAPATIENELASWLLFIDQVPVDTRARLLDRAQEELWLRGKTLTRQREDALGAEVVREKADGYGVLPLLLSRQIKLLTAELEFVEELRRELDEWDRARAAQQGAESAVARDASSIPASRQPAKRQKGAPRR
jgi:DNA-binding PadR family transcriptional regulator